MEGISEADKGLLAALEGMNGALVAQRQQSPGFKTHSDRNVQ